jgi:pimeloyl-ACP methyl ester carboxylesterase
MPELLRGGGWLLAVLAAGYAALCLGMYLLQGRLVYRPGRGLVADPSDAGLAYEEVWIPAGGERVHAWYVPAPDAESKEGPGRGTVLFCHGNGGNISHRLETLRLLHGLGMHVLLFDYRGYGRSEGSPSEVHTREDALACWEWLLAERGEPPERIVVMGRSLGGAVAARLAVDAAGRAGPIAAVPIGAGPVTRPVPAGLVLESTFTSIADMGARSYPWLPVKPLTRHRYDTRPLLPRVRCPVLVAHSPDDGTVPWDMGRELFSLAPEPKAFLELSGAHNDGWQQTGEPYRRALDDFFRAVLP